MTPNSVEQTISAVQPVLTTARLILRPFLLGDAAEVQRLAGDVRIARGTSAVPHPYPEGVAQAWISAHPQWFDDRKEIIYAVTERSSKCLLGAVSLLNISRVHSRAELGFWIGVDFWSKGYCTEAVRALMHFGIDSLAVTRFVGRCLAWNTASATVMRNAGLLPEGRLVLHELRDGQFVDQLLFGCVMPERQESAPPFFA